MLHAVAIQVLKASTHLERKHCLLICVVEAQPQHHQSAVQLLVEPIKEVVLLQMQHAQHNHKASGHLGPLIARMPQAAGAGNHLQRIVRKQHQSYSTPQQHNNWACRNLGLPRNVVGSVSTCLDISVVYTC